MKDGYDTEWFIGPNVSRNKVMKAAIREVEEWGDKPFVHDHTTDEACNENCLDVEAYMQRGEGHE